MYTPDLLSTTTTTSHTFKMDIRLLHPSDIPHVQTTNITNLPENYFCKYYMYHQLSWPQLSYVAVDVRIAAAQEAEREPMLTASSGLKTQEDTLRCAEDRRLRTCKDGGGPSRWHTARPHHISQCHAHTQATGSGREAHASKSYVWKNL